MAATTRAVSVFAVLAWATWATALAQPPPPSKEVSAAISLVADGVPASISRLRALVNEKGAELESETEETSYDATVRLPPERARDFVSAVCALGEVEGRTFTMSDTRVTRANLAAQRAQLEQSLKGPSGAGSAEERQEQLSATRGQLRELEAEELASADRAARATVTIRIRPREPAPAAPVYSGDVRFYPGVRASHLYAAGGTGERGLFGAGLEVHPVRWFDFEAELFRDVSALAGRPGADGGLFTLGADASSELLGDGKRRFFNPHLGLRTGLATMFGRADLALGASVGLELLRLSWLVVDAQLRLLGLVGNRAGPLLLVQSGLSVDFGY